MKFLDSNGLTHFWSKIKDWANSNFFSNEGGEISPKSGLRYIINGEQLDVSKTGNENESISIFNVDENGISAERIVMNGGTATQVLMANGSVKTLNANNGIAGLDSNGNVPLAQLGNLDTTVAEVVTALPTTNIKKHIYLIKDPKGVTQNQYEEYIYTGNTSATYDSSKWEKLGEFRATVDLADYAKKSEAVNNASYESSDYAGRLHFNNINGERISSCVIDIASFTKAGLMIPNDKKKLNRLDISSIDGTDNIDIGCLVTCDGVAASVDSSDNSISVSLPTLNNLFTLDFSLPAAGDMAGVMTAADKTKLNGIAPNANNYSLPLAAKGTRGGIQVGYEANGRNYPVQLSGEKAYVNVPWTDTNTTYDLSPYAKTADVNAALAKKVDVVSGKGLSTEDFTAALKTKLNGIATGATADSAIPISVIDALN